MLYFRNLENETPWKRAKKEAFLHIPIFNMEKKYKKQQVAFQSTGSVYLGTQN